MDLELYPDSVQHLGEGAFQNVFCSMGIGGTGQNRVLLGSGTTNYPKNLFQSFMGSGERTEFVTPNDVVRMGSCSLDLGLEDYDDSDGDRVFYSHTPVTITTADKGPLTIGELDEMAVYNARFDVPLVLGKMGPSCLGCCSADIITVQSGVSTIPDYAFHDSSTSHFNMPESLKSIGVSAFENLSLLPDMNLSHTQVQSIGTRAFAGASISRLTLPDCLGSIESETFMECSMLSSLIVPASVERIGDYAFYGSAIETIHLPENLRLIGEYAFAACDALESISIPESVIKIGADAFDRGGVVLEVGSGSYGQSWAQENGIPIVFTGGEDLSWLGKEYSQPVPEVSEPVNDTSIPDYWNDPEGFVQFLAGATYNDLCRYFTACEEQRVDVWAILKNAYSIFENDPSKLEQRFGFDDVDTLSEDTLSFWKAGEYLLLIGGAETSDSAEGMARALADSNTRTYACGKAYVSISDFRK